VFDVVCDQSIAPQEGVYAFMPMVRHGFSNRAVVKPGVKCDLIPFYYPQEKMQYYSAVVGNIEITWPAAGVSYE
jgi:hypothetical protein